MHLVKDIKIFFEKLMDFYSYLESSKFAILPIVLFYINGYILLDGFGDYYSVYHQEGVYFPLTIILTILFTTLMSRLLYIYNPQKGVRLYTSGCLFLFLSVIFLLIEGGVFKIFLLFGVILPTIIYHLFYFKHTFFNVLKPVLRLTKNPFKLISPDELIINDLLKNVNNDEEMYKKLMFSSKLTKKTKKSRNKTIFICYRRDDSAYAVDSLYDSLIIKFGKGNVFRDINLIPPGDDFISHINQRILRSDLFLLVIGPGWLKVSKETTHPRISNEKDTVRLEIKSALQSNIYILPILIGSAIMPSKNDLPETISCISSLNAFNLRPAPDFKMDIYKLFEQIDLINRPIGIKKIT